jgi:nucleotide-binding universal stress UspA family protein
MSKVIAETAGTTATEAPPAAWYTPAIPLDGSREENWWSALNALDLAVYTPPPQTWFQRWLWPSPAQQLIEQSRRSLLILQQPRWPLTHILFIVRAEQSDWCALSWIERLAQPRETTVTILPVVPPYPRFHRSTPYAQPTPEILLAPNTISGAMLTRMVQRLQQQHIAVTLSLNTGEPDWRIRNAADMCHPDLIVIAAETEKRWLRWLYGELVSPLLRWVTCPLLITK